MDLNTYSRSAIIQHITGTAAMTAPTALYAEMHTGDPGLAGTANTSAETTRKIVAWAAENGGSQANSAVVRWDTVAVTGTESITWLQLWDAPTGGNPIIRCDLTSATTITNGEPVEIPVGDLTVTAA